MTMPKRKPATSLQYMNQTQAYVTAFYERLGFVREEEAFMDAD